MNIEARFPVRTALTLEEHYDLLDRWVAWLRAAERSGETIRNYEAGILRFHRQVRTAPGEVTEDTITAWMAAQRQRPQALMVLRALKSYYSWAYRRGIHPANPTADIPSPRKKMPPAVALEPNELEGALIAAARRKPKRAWTILLVVETGGRVGSIAALEPEDVPTEPGAILHFRFTKGDRPYAVPLSPLGARAARELHACWEGGPKLIGVHKNTIWSWWHQAAIAAGLPKRKRRAHILRDTFATRLVERGVDLRTVQELLGHADLSQMHRYAAVTDPRKLRAVEGGTGSAGAFDTLRPDDLMGETPKR